MRTLILAALVLPLTAVSADASSWYRVGGNDKSQSYVDFDTIRPIGNKTVVASQTVYSTPLEGGVRGVSIRSEYDCADGYFRTLEYSYYGEGGRLIETEPSATINERKVPAKGSINEAILDFVCYRKGGTLVTNPFIDAPLQFAK